ncbi:putative membrane protein [Kitasatospora gansuensis]|uniref:Putative membrane protein n=1 Tax=Kitasatospora gansuensis TaxID=258050 RepID=A0A7W7WKM9_9ACTN|nr:anthrone oxygenase family protein [Kitasatospora gansuensis]MBB4950368.1 putative membrane protein [Kitasatospora gansuensis]
MTGFRGAVLVAATLTMGLSAGLFFAYSCSVMPGLAKADDRTFVETMQRINVAILNGWFMLVFLGAIVFTLLAVVLQFRGGERRLLPWLIAAAVLYLVVLAVTGAVNVPLNDQLAAAGSLDKIPDLAAVRETFESTWVRWNTVRTVSATAGFGCLVAALVVGGRSAV